jgi:malate synthase
VQYHVRREDVRVSAADLINCKNIPGKVTHDGVRSNVAVAVAYAGAWIAGNGCIPYNWLMEDAATAEIARVQLWQWVHYATRLDTGDAVTAELVDRLAEDVMGDVRKAVPNIREEHVKVVKEYIKAQVRQPWPSEFLTSDLMPYLAAADGVPAKFQKSSL